MEPTKFADLLNVGDPTKKAALESRNVLFMEDGVVTAPSPARLIKRGKFGISVWASVLLDKFLTDGS